MLLPFCVFGCSGKSKWLNKPSKGCEGFYVVQYLVLSGYVGFSVWFLSGSVRFYSSKLSGSISAVNRIAICFSLENPTNPFWHKGFFIRKPRQPILTQRVFQ